MFDFIKKIFEKQQSLSDSTSSIKTPLDAKFKKIKFQDQIYLIVSFVMILLIVFIFYNAIVFIAKMGLQSFAVDEQAVQEQNVRFNIDDYEKVIPKLLKK